MKRHNYIGNYPKGSCSPEKGQQWKSSKERVKIMNVSTVKVTYPMGWSKGTVLVNYQCMNKYEWDNEHMKSASMPIKKFVQDFQRVA